MSVPIDREFTENAIVTFLGGHRHENSRGHETEQFELLS